MPFVQRVVEPKFLSRRSLHGEDGLPLVTDYELEAVTNNTLSSALRQLASLVLIANDIFEDLAKQLQDVCERSKKLRTRIETVEEKIVGFDPKSMSFYYALSTAVDRSDVVCNGLVVNQHLNNSSDSDVHLFKNEALNVYQRAIDYLQKWFDYDSSLLKELTFLSLNDTFTLSVFTEIVNILHVNIEVDFENGDALFQEYFLLKEMTPILKDLPTPQECWNTVLKTRSVPNLKKIAEHIHALPY
ncbi:hypothetical protein ANN_16205 [Periplaneta americana]|uniref:Uncharacterized protein n=1 Tax=Periplaneta americana TaxID=6978 RepID=A0ABQ8SJJ5_PERAM|nr:hypothetical protein ANN_16205 [Periplaneta americana]